MQKTKSLEELGFQKVTQLPGLITYKNPEEPDAYLEISVYGGKTMVYYEAFRHKNVSGNAYTLQIAKNISKDLLDAMIQKGYELMWMANINKNEYLEDFGFVKINEYTFVQEGDGYKNIIVIKDDCISPYYIEEGDEIWYSYDIPYEILVAIKNEIENPKDDEADDK